MRFREFAKANIGKCLDYDKAYAGQCVDLFRFYRKDALGLPAQPRPVDGAAAFFENYANDKVLRDNFTLIKNTPEAVPRYGDVIIWNRKKGKGYGHISVFIHGDAIGFTSFDQNWPLPSKCTETGHDYVNVLGWLRPRNQKGVTGVRQEGCCYGSYCCAVRGCRFLGRLHSAWSPCRTGACCSHHKP